MAHCCTETLLIFLRLIELDCYTTTAICDWMIMMMITAILLIELDCYTSVSPLHAVTY